MVLMVEAIVTRNLTKKFKDLVAVNHVNIDVKKGEIFGLLGPNGAGKTTLIRMLCTLLAPTEGTAEVAGYDIIKQDGKVREHIGLVSEKMIMYDRLTAEGNLKLFGKLYNIPKDTLEKRTHKLLKLVHMEKWAKSQIGTYSTGMKQRINIIRALLSVPDVLFMDEPTLGLDPQSTTEIREFIKRINIENETSIILTTHMMVEADMLCDRVGIIDRGKIVALDTPPQPEEDHWRGGHRERGHRNPQPDERDAGGAEGPAHDSLSRKGERDSPPHQSEGGGRLRRHHRHYQGKERQDSLRQEPGAFAGGCLPPHNGKGDEGRGLQQGQVVPRGRRARTSDTRREGEVDGRW